MADETSKPKEPHAPAPHESFAAHRAGREPLDPGSSEEQRLAQSFADPNSRDDIRLGRSFEETNSSRKRHKTSTHVLHKPASWRPALIVLGCILLLMLVGALVGWLPRHRRDERIDQQARARANAKPVVEVQRVLRVHQQQGLVLPGTTIPLTEAYIYARANGYLKRRFVDIGDHVAKDQLLAIIEAPDLDAEVMQAQQQLRTAEQQLEQQRSQLALATVTVNRWRVLVAKGVFSRQEGDQQETNYTSAVANVAAAQRNVDAYRANLLREQALQGFEKVRAPFTGIITQRNVDVGALIAVGGSTTGAASGSAPLGQTSATGGSEQAGQTNTAGASGVTSTAATPAQSPGQGGPLFGIAQVQRLRILVSVPEGYVNSIRARGHAELHFQAYPGEAFVGDVTRTADSVDPNTRTMLTEVQVDNRDGRLKSGMYAVVTLPPAPGEGGPLMISGDAVVIRNDQTSVAKVVHGKVQIVPVVVGRDFGSAVEIVSGVNVGDVVVTQVTDDVVPGAEVRVHESRPPTETPTAPPSQNKPPGGTSRYGDIGITDQSMQGQAQQQNAKGAHNGGHSGNQGRAAGSRSNP